MSGGGKVREIGRAMAGAPGGGVVLQRPADVRRFSILITGATDGARLALSGIQLSGLSPLEANGILSQVKIGAPAALPSPVEQPAGAEPKAEDAEGAG